MRRRTLLRIGTLATTTALAGCNQLQGGGSKRSDATFTPGARDFLAVAVGELNKAALSVRELQDTDDIRKASFDPEGPRERVSKAKKAIEKAQTAGDAKEANVSAVKKYAKAISGLVDTTVNLLEASKALKNAKETIDTNGEKDIDTEKAKKLLGTANQASSKAVKSSETVSEALSNADGDRLKKLGAEYEALTNGADTLSGFVVGVAGLAKGYDRLVTGVERLQTAQDQVDNDEFDAASKSFASAQGIFKTSAATFQKATENAAEELTSDLETGDRRSRALERLSAGYVSLLNGRDHLKTAQDEIDEDDFSGARNSLTSGTKDAKTSEQRFNEGQTIVKDDFKDEFATAIDRAKGMQSLTKGYTSLLDARDHITDAEDEIDNDQFDTARNSLQEARSKSQSADETFAKGQKVTGDVFKSEFADARNRAKGMTSLSSGYTRLLDARDDIKDAEREIENDQFGVARTSLQEARTDSDAADQTFADGQKVAGELFTSEFETARDRAQGMTSLSSGYTQLLDARDDFTDAEDEIKDDEFDTARNSLDEAETDANSADQTFASGEEVAGDIFGSEFETARDRAAGMSSLASGYSTLLDGRESVVAAEDQIENDNFDAAESSLTEGSNAADKADRTFASGSKQSGSFFQEEFSTARERADALGALSDGYKQLLDARDTLKSGRTAFENGNYDQASNSFSSAASQASQARSTFESGEPSDDRVFRSEFARAYNRTDAVESLSNGYATMVDGRKQIQTGRDQIENGNFSAASDTFSQAESTIRSANSTFSDGDSSTASAFDSEFDRALCQSGHLLDAVGHFKKAADAGANGDRVTLQEQKEKGKTDLDKVKNC